MNNKCERLARQIVAELDDNKSSETTARCVLLLRHSGLEEKMKLNELKIPNLLQRPGVLQIEQHKTFR